MRILAIDYGSKRIGLAISDPTGTLARPLPFLPTPVAKNKIPQAILALAKKEEVTLLLLGLPRHMNGELGPEGEQVKELGEALRKKSQQQVVLVDERLSTVQASRQLREAGKNSREQRTLIDSEAAAVLLQSYLDSRPDAFGSLQ